MSDIFYFNHEYGYLEALIRGLEGSLLTRTDYLNVSSSENLEDFRVALQGTDYHRVSTNISANISLAVLENAFRDKMLNEFKYIRANANKDCAKFLDFITYGYMIDNIALLISGILHQKPVNELLEKCHPLGKFERINAITVCSSPSELYNAILVDTPLAPFFAKHVSEQDFDETHVVIIRNMVYREYMEAFFEFIKKIGGITEIVMTPIMMFESDRRTLSITMNSLGTDLNKEERFKFYTTFGHFDNSVLLKLSKVDDFDQLRSIAANYPEYSKIFANYDNTDPNNSFEDAFFDMEINLHHQTFLHQFNFGIFYSYFRLVEQQMRNLIWIAECISQQKKDKIDTHVKFCQ